MPDFERRSRASFISSKEGGTPASFSLSLMKRRSSYCLRVSIAGNPQRFVARRSIPRLVRCVQQHYRFETNHERTLYVRYVFRNHLILGERDELLSGTANRWVNPAAAGCPHACFCWPPAHTGHVSLIPVPQREIRSGNYPAG